MLSKHVVHYVWFRDDDKSEEYEKRTEENHAEEDEEFTSAMQRAMNAMSPKEEVVVPLEGGEARPTKRVKSTGESNK